MGFIWWHRRCYRYLCFNPNECGTVTISLFNKPSARNVRREIERSWGYIKLTKKNKLLLSEANSHNEIPVNYVTLVNSFCLYRFILVWITFIWFKTEGQYDDRWLPYITPSTVQRECWNNLVDNKINCCRSLVGIVFKFRYTNTGSVSHAIWERDTNSPNPSVNGMEQIFCKSRVQSVDVIRISVVRRRRVKAGAMWWTLYNLFLIHTLILPVNLNTKCMLLCNDTVFAGKQAFRSLTYLTNYFNEK